MCRDKHCKCQNKCQNKCQDKCKDKHSKCKKACHSLFCDSSNLEERLFRAVSQPVTVTRNTNNIPTIEGGTFAEMYEAFGYVTQVDRMFSAYLYYKESLGQNSEIFGADYVDYDISIRKVLYTDEQYLEEFAKYSKPTRVAFESFVKGCNKRIQEVLDGVAPLAVEFTILGVNPELYTLVGILKYNHWANSAFSSLRNEYTLGLFGFAQIENLVENAGYSIEEATNIVLDLYNMRLKSKAGIVAKNTDTFPKSCKKSQNKTRTTENKTRTTENKTRTTEKKIQNRMNINMKSNEKLSGKDFVDIYDRKGKKGSFAAVIGKEKSATKLPIISYGPQTGYLYPMSNYSVNFINKELEFEKIYDSFLLSFDPQGTTKNKSYILSTTLTSGNLPGIPALLEDPSEDIYLRTETIQVKDSDPVTFDIFISPYGGVVEGLFSSSLFEGEKSLVQRQIDYGKDLSFLDVVFLMNFVSSEEELVDTIRGPGWTSCYDYSFNGFDNYGNIFAIELAGWYDFNTTLNIIPQGVLGNPIPPSDSVPRQGSYIVKNPKKGYVSNWNNRMILDLPSVIGSNESIRVAWIDQYIESFGKHDYALSDAQHLFVHVANAKQNARYPDNVTTLNYNASSFYLFRDSFLEDVYQNPSDTRNIAIELLQNYNGEYIEGDDLAIINSLDVSDKWYLSQQWMYYFQRRIIGNVFGPAHPGFPNSFNRNSGGFTYSSWIFGLMARLLGVTDLNNPVYYPEWLTGLDVNQVIVESLDEALAFLGPRPWGIGTRPLQTTNYEYLGFYLDLDIPNNPFPAANRPFFYFLSNLNRNGTVDTSTVYTFGESGEITLNEDGAAVPVDLRQRTAFLNCQPMIRETIHKN